MKLFIFVFFVIIVSMISGILIAEVSYVMLLLIKYLAYGYIDFSYSEVLKGIRAGGTGGGILGIGIILCRLLKVKGF